MNFKEVIVYTKLECPYCDATRSLLDWNDIEYTEVDITNMSKRTFKSNVLFQDEHVPKIFIDGKHIGSYQQLVDYIAKETL